jgi:hypothetical protein
VFVAMQEIRARVGKNIYHQTRVERRLDWWEEELYCTTWPNIFIVKFVAEVVPLARSVMQGHKNIR